MLNLLTQKFSNIYFKKYFFNTGWLVSDQTVKIILSTLVSIFVTRYLQPERYGLFSYAMSLVGLVASVATLGINNIVINDLVRTKEKYIKILGTAFWLRIIGASAAMLFLIILAILEKNPVTFWLILILSTTLIIRSFEIIPLYFQAVVKIKSIVLSQMVAITLSSFFKIFGVILQLGVVSFAAFQLLEFTLISIFAFIIFRREVQTSFLNTFDKKIAMSLLSRAWPVIISSLMASIYMRIDQVMLAQLTSYTQTGIYASAAKLSESWYFIPVAITSSLYPALIKTADNKLLFTKRFQQLSSLLFLISLLVVIPVSVLSSRIITLLYGSSFSAAGDILAVHIWSSPFIFLNIAANQWLIIKNKQKIGTLVTLFGALLNITLNFILIPRYGALGSAYATLVSYAFSGYLAYLLFKETRNLFFTQTKAIMSLPFFYKNLRIFSKQ